MKRKVSDEFTNGIDRSKVRGFVRSSVAIMIAGAVLVLLGAVMCFLQLYNMHNGFDGSVETLSTQVTGISEQTDVLQEDNATTTAVRYHLLTNVVFDGEERIIMLDEAYPTKSAAEVRVGEIRDVSYDTSSFVEVHPDAFRPFSLAVCFFGIILILGALLIRYKYSSCVYASVLKK